MRTTWSIDWSALVEWWPAFAVALLGMALLVWWFVPCWVADHRWMRLPFAPWWTCRRCGAEPFGRLR